MARFLHCVKPIVRFDEGYNERVELPDGTPIVLRLVQPSDKQLLQRGFERLSPESRYRRFMGAKSSLSEAELKYLTEVDGVNHLAIVAAHECPDGSVEGVGIARFVRLSNRLTVAEAAVTVIDEWQNRRIGTLLLERLAAAARERGVLHFRAVAMPNNPGIRALMKELGSAVTVQSDGDQVVIDVGLYQAAQREAELEPGPLRRMLRAFAESTALERRAPESIVKGAGN